MDQKERQAALIQKRLAEVRKALKVLSDPMNWERRLGEDVRAAVFLTTAAGKGGSHRVNPLQLAKEALEGLDEARRLLPRFLGEEEKEPITLAAKMKGEGGTGRKAMRGPLHLPKE